MLRLDATVISLSLPEVKAYGHNHQFKDLRRRAATNQLSTSTSPKTRWQSLYEATDPPIKYPSDRPPLVLPYNTSTTAEGLEISAGGGNGSGANDNHNKTEKASSVNFKETMALISEHYTDPTGTTSILRPPLPPPFASTPRVSSLLYQPSTRFIALQDDRQPPCLHLVMTHITLLQ
ncbi:hypothetical protein LZ30DRAFT_751728 [Colletotrichum cereale]|nr:hypothetical protein LZ30DRAFT_751728 [Colletotrichum cereale]